MIYEFLVPRKEWTEEKFKRFLKQGQSCKLNSVIIRGKLNRLHQFFVFSEYNTRGTNYKNITDSEGRAYLHANPLHSTISRTKYPSLILSGLYYRFYYTDCDLEYMCKKSKTSNVELIVKGLKTKVGYI